MKIVQALDRKELLDLRLGPIPLLTMIDAGNRTGCLEKLNGVFYKNRNVQSNVCYSIFRKFFTALNSKNSFPAERGSWTRCLQQNFLHQVLLSPGDKVILFVQRDR